MLRRYRTGFVVALIVIVGITTVYAAPEEQTDEELPLRQAFIYWQKGYVLHMLGAYEAAAWHFRMSIEAEPTAEGHTYLGWSLSHLGQIEDAIEECKKAIEIDSDYGNPYNDIGVYLIDLGSPDEAIPWFERAMRAKRYCCYQFPHFNMGRVLLMRGQLEKAKQYFERALSYDPEYLPALQALEYLRSREGEPL